MGLPAAADPGAGGGARPQQVALLADLISGIAGEAADKIAQLLLGRFGTVLGTLRQTELPETLLPLVGEAVTARLTYLAAAFDQSLRDEAIEELQLGSLDAVMRYLQTYMAGRDREMFRAFFLDGSNRLLADRVMWTGTVDRVQAHPRELVRVALDVGAVAVLVVHNHVSAPPQPSQEDLRVTAKLVQAFAPFDLTLSDHLIVARQGCYSMRAAGVLARIERECRSCNDAIGIAA